MSLGCRVVTPGLLLQLGSAKSHGKHHMSNQKFPQIPQNSKIPSHSTKYDIPLVVLNMMSIVSFFPHVVFEFEWRETSFVRFHLGAKLDLSPFRTSWGHAQMSLRIISPLGATNISKLCGLQMNFPNFPNLQKSTLCRVSKFWHAGSTVSAPKGNSQFLNEMNTLFRCLELYTACNLLETQAPALRVPHYHIVHRILSSDMMHPFPRWKLPPKNSSIPRENGHISEINNDPRLWEDRKKERKNHLTLHDF